MYINLGQKNWWHKKRKSIAMTQCNQVPWHNCPATTACLGLKGTAPRDPKQYSTEQLPWPAITQESLQSAPLTEEKEFRACFRVLSYTQRILQTTKETTRRNCTADIFGVYFCISWERRGIFKILFLTITEILQCYDSTTPKLIKKTEETSVCEKKAIKRVNQIPCLIETRHRKSHLP